MNIAIILSGGTGTRLGSDIPKQYIEVKGRPIIAYCLDTFCNNRMIDRIQIVADEIWHDVISDCEKSSKLFGFSRPGKTRQLSIYNALSDIENRVSSDDIVIIHDAARPFVSDEMIDNCLTAAAAHDGVLPVLPMKDTVYFSDDGKRVSALVERKKVFAGQAPEAFKFGKYLSANRALLPDKILDINGSAEPAIIAGMDIVMVDGDENNFKITTKADLDRFIEIVRK